MCVCVCVAGVPSNFYSPDQAGQTSQHFFDSTAGQALQQFFDSTAFICFFCACTSLYLQYSSTVVQAIDNTSRQKPVRAKRHKFPCGMSGSIIGSTRRVVSRVYEQEQGMTMDVYFMFHRSYNHDPSSTPTEDGTLTSPPYTTPQLYSHTTMLRFTIFTVTVTVCSSFLQLSAVLTARSSFRVDNLATGSCPVTPTNTATTTVRAVGHCRREQQRQQLSMSSTSSPDPDHPSQIEPFSEPVDRRKLLTKTIPASLALGVLGITAAVTTTAPGRTTAASGSCAMPKPAPAGTKVVVLGGNGFVGSKVCEMLIEAGELFEVDDTSLMYCYGWDRHFCRRKKIAHEQQ